MSDNGPEYSALSFKKFSIRWDFKHDTSSPNFPRSNGFVERMIQTVKRTIKKAIDAKEDPYLAQLSLRTTPGENGVSPSYQLMRRTVRNNMPYQCERTRQQISSTPEDHRKVVSRSYQPLNNGDAVRIRGKTDWKDQGVVLEKSKYPRSYLLENQLGNQIRRNRRHVIPTNEEMKYENESVDDCVVVNNPAAGSDCQQVERLVDNGMVSVPSEGRHQTLMDRTEM